MEELLQRYAKLIVKTQLQLQQGEALSINTEANTIEFARMLAKHASEATIHTVNIVQTNHGKVVQVIPIEPVEPEVLRPDTKGFAMVHIVNLDDMPYETEEEPAGLAADVTRLGMFGLLSEPVFLDRRLAVPWANIPYPGPNWAMKLLGPEATEYEMWRLFASLLRLEDDRSLRFWEDQGNLLHYRKQKTGKLGSLHFSLVGDGWALEADMANGTQWSGGRNILPSSRTFLSQLPMQSIHASLDSLSARGTIVASRPFLLFGHMVEDARFTLKEGKVVSYSARTGKSALDAFFSVDAGATTASGLSLADNDTTESHLLSKATHPHFNESMTSSVSFGGFRLDTLTTQANDEEVDQCRLNRSLVRLEVPIGSTALSITAIDAEGQSMPLMEEGVFLD